MPDSIESPAADALTSPFFELAPEPSCVLDPAGRFLRVNRAWTRVLGHESEALHGRACGELAHPDDRAALAAGWEAVLAAGGGEFEGHFQQADGGYRPLRWSVAAAHDASVMFAVVHARCEWSEVALRRAEARLMQADRMASVGTLAAGVAHEINNPLTYVIGNLSIAAEQLGELSGALQGAVLPEDPAPRLEEITQALAEATNGAERVRCIVRDLKTFSRPEGDRRTEVDVHAVLDSTLQMASNEIRHRARLVREYSAIPTVAANESRLAQVFLNLVVNAAQAITEGSAADHEIRVSARPDDAGRVVVEVKDSGCGIPSEVVGRIFDPFFTTKPVGVGIGLGLSISRSIVIALGGEITVRSAVGKGTTVRVVLPVGPASVLPPARAQSETPPPASPQVRVLVVDDEPAIGRVLERVLRPHEVVLVESGREALRQLALDPGFDLVLCDLMMPDVTGMALFEQACALLPGLEARFVFMTGGAFTPQAREFLATVPNPRLTKPFDLERVRVLLRELLARRAD